MKRAGEKTAGKGKKERVASAIYGLSALVLVMLVLFESTQLPTINNETVLYLDKIAHFATYGLLAFLFGKWVQSLGFKSRCVAALLVVLGTLLIGFTAEWLQSISPERLYSVSDLLANFLGALSMVIFLFWIRNPSDCDRA